MDKLQNANRLTVAKLGTNQSDSVFISNRATLLPSHHPVTHLTFEQILRGAVGRDLFSISLARQDFFESTEGIFQG